MPTNPTFLEAELGMGLAMGIELSMNMGMGMEKGLEMGINNKHVFTHYNFTKGSMIFYPVPTVLTNKYFKSKNV